MPTVKLDVVRGSRCVERSGYVMELERIAHVRELTSYDSGTILDAIDASGLPDPGDQHPDEATLILEDRVVRRAVSASYVEVALVYRRHFTTADWFAEGTASLRGTTLYTDSGGTSLTVEHDGDTRGTSINVDQGVEDIVIEIVESTNSPGNVARAFLNKLNSAVWLGDAIGTWRCTRVDYIPAILTVSPQLWRFLYVFSYNPSGHQPQVVYIDPVSGRPVANPVAGVGIKTITHYDSTDFGTKFS